MNKNTKIRAQPTGAGGRYPRLNLGDGVRFNAGHVDACAVPPHEAGNRFCRIIGFQILQAVEQTAVALMRAPIQAPPRLLRSSRNATLRAGPEPVFWYWLE